PLVPLLAAMPLGDQVLGMPAPGADGVFTRPVGNCDTEAVFAAGRFNAEEPRLATGQFLHARRRLGIPVAGLDFTYRGKDDGVTGQRVRALVGGHGWVASGEG